MARAFDYDIELDQLDDLEDEQLDENFKRVIRAFEKMEEIITDINSRLEALE